MANLTTTATFRIDTSQTTGSVGAGAQVALSADRVLSYVHCQTAQVHLEGLEDDGVTWTRCESQESTAIALDPPTFMGGMGTGQLRFNNTAGGSLDYRYQWWYIV